MDDKFTWVAIYGELARELLSWENRQGELIAFLEDLRIKGCVVTRLQDKAKDGSIFLLQEIDPFTFFGVFNRGIKFEERIRILAEIKNFFNLQSDIPTDFSGIPILNNMRSLFFTLQNERADDDVQKLWRVFTEALGSDPLNSPSFSEAFDKAAKVKGVNVNLTMGLFWIRPEVFFNLDQVNRSYFDLKLPASGLSTQYYKEVLEKLKNRPESFPELSLEAWQAAKQMKTQDVQADKESDYWLVGAYWYDQDPVDQTDRFVSEGAWVNGYSDKLLDEVNSMKVGDKIAIKASSTQKIGLPFDFKNKTVSKMEIKARGTIVANRGDGKTVEVEWESGFIPRTWYFYTNRSTIWHLNTEKNYRWAELVKRLIDFVWFDADQDYSYFLNSWLSEEDDTERQESMGILPPYSIDEMIASGVFLESEELSAMRDKLISKKAMIIQGVPGVGKTFIAKKLAYALMEEQAPDRVGFIQFHQSYSYDDFIRGYRPMPGQAGTFGLQDGVFYEFCKKASRDPDRDYVFIIDEINRGNLSQIFGEVMMLIEADKRGEEYAVPLVYRKTEDEKFFVPKNLYLIGLMNVADRSLAMVDYALRRRFSFVTLTPKYDSLIFHRWLAEREMDEDLIQLIILRMNQVNRLIQDDPLLGENYQIGHSFFCPKGDKFNGLDHAWYLGIVETEIVPLLKEYWFDNSEKAQEAESILTR